MNFFTADEHFGHKNIIKYCKRPFKHVDDMNQNMIDNHNSIVSDSDTTYHLGDFTLRGSRGFMLEIFKQLNGKHVLIKGSHDNFKRNLNFGNLQLVTENILEVENIILCHYQMHVWPKSHYGSWHLFGHNHCTFDGVGKSFDVGVDGNMFFPYSYESVVGRMAELPDNVNQIRLV